MNLTRVASSLFLAAGLASTPAWSQAVANPPSAVTSTSVQRVAADIWAKARANDLGAVIAAGLTSEDTPFYNDFAVLRQSVAKREATRSAQIEKVTKKLDDLRKGGDQSPLTLSKALKEAVELHMLAPSDQKAAVLASERVRVLIADADAAARKAERDGEWLFANELFGRLNLLLEDSRVYKADSERVVDRLGMVRLYTPKRFWELRDARQKLDKDAKPLPAFNDAGEHYADKLRGITRSAVLKALSKAADGHVERIPMRTILSGGLDRLKTLVSTHDLDAVFPKIADREPSFEVLGYLTSRAAEFKTSKSDPTDFAVSSLLGDLIRLFGDKLSIPEEVVLHEFGSGAFGELDDFSAIIWPSELAAFERITANSFNGVGIQIQFDDDTQLIKVVQPIDGTPAQRAGIKAGDLIKKINEKSAVGMSTDQAIEQITGPRGTNVVLTIERAGKEIPFDLTRAAIPLRTAKGWKRTGTGDSDWDYVIDHDAKIGYLRLSGFGQSTTAELHHAVKQAQASGMNGFIVDLRFNPGGLLTEAVTVANTFVADGTIVATKSAGGVPESQEDADPRGQLVKNGIPVVVLINNGSASASEIVAGALRYYGDTGAVNALVIGERSFGKGSVQNIYPLSQKMQMKLTKQYYYLPDGTCIHHRDGAVTWGVKPNLDVEMLPKQITDALTLRIDADTPPEGRVARKPIEGEEPLGEPDPDRLIKEGFDLQLQTALAVLRAQAAARNAATTAQKDTTKGG